MRELFDATADAHGLQAPAGVLVTEGPVDEVLVEQVRARLAGFAGGGIEEFGYAYESLLAAEDRKNAGAHYTPLALADEVVEHALAPLADRAVLDLRILDIATGSGIFLVAAARRLANAEASLFEVIRTCLHGADVNATTVEICKLSLWLLAGDDNLPLTFLDDKILVGDSLIEEVGIGGRRPVNWTTVAPTVMAAGGFDAVIGNPPFLGVKNIRTAVGAEVRDHYAATLLGGESGRSDLVVFFLAQAARLSRNVVGLVVPDAISEGDSARFGPGRALANGYRLYRAETSRPWPGAAGVRIALIWLQRVDPAGQEQAVLDGVPVVGIGPSLGRQTSLSNPRRTPPTWMPHGYQATIVLGKSLVLSPAEAAALIEADPRTATWIHDYLSGEDLVSKPGSASSRRVLDLGGTDLEALLAVPALADRLAGVRAERAEQFAKYPQLRDRWWGFLNRVDRLYEAIAEEPEVIALSKHAKYVWPVLVGTGPTFSNGVIVYPSADRGLFAFLASTPHRLWAIDEGGSRLNQSHRYNPSRLLATYPFPDSFDSATDAGEELVGAVAAAQDELGVSVTDLLNQVHGRAPVPEVVAGVRAAFVAADRAILATHGITERFEYAVRTDRDRPRFGLDRTSESEVKGRLIG
jgi:hypothetical protein